MRLAKKYLNAADIFAEIFKLWQEVYLSLQKYHIKIPQLIAKNCKYNSFIQLHCSYIKFSN